MKKIKRKINSRNIKKRIAFIRKNPGKRRNNKNQYVNPHRDKLGRFLSKKIKPENLSDWKENTEKMTAPEPEYKKSYDTLVIQNFWDEEECDRSKKLIFYLGICCGVLLSLCLYWILLAIGGIS